MRAGVIKPKGPMRAPLARSRTQVLGVGFAEIAIRGRKVPHYVATWGRRTRTFNIRRLGKDEAFRRALKVRAAYESAWREGSVS